MMINMIMAYRCRQDNDACALDPPVADLLNAALNPDGCTHYCISSAQAQQNARTVVERGVGGESGARALLGALHGLLVRHWLRAYARIDLA